MAIGRRKAFSRGTLTTVNATLLTAGAAPTDGSARASVTMTLCDVDAAARTVTIAKGPSGATKKIYNTFPIAANDTIVHNVTMDLMGAEIIEGLASANSAIDYHFDGVEAKDA